MKKLLIIAVSTLLTLFVVLAALAEIAAFTVIKPTADLINIDLAKYFSAKLVRIPQAIPPVYEFDQTSYSWEMETLEKEVVGVKFKHQTGFSKNQNTIEVTLEMSENGDASIFDKVLPAVIVDPQSLNSAKDPKKANLSPNEEVGYSSIQLELKPTTNQTTKITWNFPKENLDENLPSLYNKMAKYPEPLIRFLYDLSEFTLGFFRG